MEMKKHLVGKIISGGQTGIDQAALDVAIFREIPHGGWCPRGRRSEVGEIPGTYLLKETDSRDYTVRTEKNVIDSDGTLILFFNALSGGTRLTRKLCIQHGRPNLSIDLALVENGADLDRVAKSNEVIDWLKKNNIQVLNIAGPRESSHEGITKIGTTFLLNVFREPVD